jgi:RNA polymerase sigma factor (sigma-70 family)
LPEAIVLLTIAYLICPLREADTAVRSFDPSLLEVAFSMARRFGASREDAEDIAQEALLKLVTYGESIGNPVAWLYVVTRRLERRLAKQAEAALYASPEIVDPWPAKHLSVDAQRLLAQLSPRCQMSLWLSSQGFTERESAERLGCSVKATEKALHKARRELRHLLGSP